MRRKPIKPKTAKAGTKRRKKVNFLSLRSFSNMNKYYIIKIQAVHLIVIMFGVFILGSISGSFFISNRNSNTTSDSVLAAANQESYWLMLHRKSNVEYLYKGVPGDESQSELVRTFKVKTGIPGQRPTPLPHLLGREYFILIGKMATPQDPETAPYFLTLDIPVSDYEPYGPIPYVECEGQCSWTIPGFFGLHGVGGDSSKLSKEDPGSSGCVRHSDEDITYLYNTLDPNREEIRYYIYDI